MAELHHDQWLWRFEAPLHEQGDKSVTITRHLSVCRQFLRYLQETDISVDQVSPPILDAYVQRHVQRYPQRYGHRPRDVRSAKHWFISGLPPLLRFVPGQWPPPPSPAHDLERFHPRLCADYAEWLPQCRGLSPATINLQHGRAQQFLAWLGDRAAPEHVAARSGQSLDTYFMAMAPRYRRHPRAGVAHGVRDVLRYLHRQGMSGQDLAATVTCPTRYALESMPLALLPDDIDTVLGLARQNRTPVGLRHYAILLLLAHYGLRSGEVVRLRLEDIDWHHDRFRIRQAKSGTETVLPLLAPVGNAVLDYLQHGRPQTIVREGFVCAYAPHRPLPALHHIVSRLLSQAGLEAEGRRGPHPFRHARAVSLFRERISLQTVSNILGHRSSAQTRL